MIKTSGNLQLALYGLPKIKNLYDFSSYTNLSAGLLYQFSRFSEKYYYSFTIPKKNKGHRTIHQPSSKLKAIQGWILRNILDRLSVSDASKGFVRGENIRDNAMPHIAAKAIMCLDIDDFFTSIKAKHVYSIFRNIGYEKRIAAIFTSMCTYKGYLPQGAPTSPRLSNLACLRLDARILGYVGKKRISYTRYADDMTFSSFSYTNLKNIYKTIKEIIQSEGFTLNNDKTRYFGPARRHKVTGLIVHKSDVGIGHVKYRQLRAGIYSLCKLSIEDEIDSEQINTIKGWISFTALLLTEWVNFRGFCS